MEKRANLTWRVEQRDGKGKGEREGTDSLRSRLIGMSQTTNTAVNTKNTTTTTQTITDTTTLRTSGTEEVGTGTGTQTVDPTTRLRTTTAG